MRTPIWHVAGTAALALLLLLASAGGRAQRLDLSEVPRRFIVDAEPPRASARLAAPAGHVRDGAGASDLLGVALYLERFLRDAGHDDLGWFYVHPENVQDPGFAVVLPAEDADAGAAAPGFWARLARFFTGSPPTTRRVVALYYTEPPFARSSRAPAPDQLVSWQARGSSAPFERMRLDLADDHRLTALVYLVEASPLTGDLAFVPQADARTHLAAANLLPLFALGGTDP